MNDYWERRKAREMYDYMEEAEKVADQIAKLYLKASRYISTQADAIFEKFVTKHHLSEAEARRLLNILRDRTSLDELLEKLRNGDMSQGKEELLAQLEAPAYQSRLERLKQLQNQLDYVMQNIYQQEKVFTTAHYVDLANQAYYRGIFDIQQRVGAAFSFNVIDPKVIDQVTKSRWSGKNYSESIWKNTRALAQDLKEELLINLVTGRTNREAAEIINNKFASGASAARRVIRTESNYVATELNFKAYEEAGIEKYRYCAILDLRTSTICRELDNKIFLVSEREAGKNSPPMHPWCRSTTIEVITEELANSLKRSARDPATGKVLELPGSMSYQEWYDKYVKGRPDAELVEKQIKNRSADRKQYKKYRDILGDEVPKTLDEFQKMKYNEPEKWNQLKAGKQDRLNQMDFSEMDRLSGTLGNREVRAWYKAHDEKIPDLIDKTLPIEQQARQACKLRNDNRTAARELMKDQDMRKQLDITDPNKSFEELMQHKIQDKGLSYEDAVKDILETATKTRKSVNKMFGLE